MSSLTGTAVPVMETLTILLAEPDSLAAGTISSQLQEQGYTVVDVAARGEDALLAAAATRPGVVILDTALPCPESPLQTAIEIRDRLGIPVLLTTTGPRGALSHEGEARLSSHEILEKPFGPESLGAAVEAVAICSRLGGPHRAWDEAFRQAADSVPGFIMILDANRRIRYINHPGAALGGGSPYVLAGLDAVGTVLPSSDRDGADLRQRFGTGREFLFVADSVPPGRCRVRVRWTCEPARGAGGCCTGWVCFGVEEEEEAAPLKPCLQEEVLQRLDENIVQLSTLNDRIRNPLQVIAASAEFVDDDARDKILLQVEAINDVVRQLDRGDLESEAVRDYLRKHREIQAP